MSAGGRGAPGTGPGPRQAVDRVLVVGRRRAAIRAVQELGLEPLLLAPRPLRRGLLRPVTHVAWSPGDDPRGNELASRAEELAREALPAGVLAATEAAVLPAAALRQRLGLPGLSPESARRCTDKLEMKRAVSAHGIACAPFVSLDEAGPAGPVARLGLPLVLKPRIGSGGRDTRWINAPRDVPDDLPEGWMAEKAIRGTEMSVEAVVAGGEARFVSCTEYLQPRWANQLPADLPEPEAAEIRRLLDDVTRAVGVDRGVVHMELFRTVDGPVFGEIAARPPGGYIMELLGLAWGFSAWSAWVQAELGGEPSLPAAPVGHAASRIFHPGPGVVTRAAGIEAARREPGVVEAVLRVAVGDRLGARRGTGQEAGHLIVRGPDRAAAVEALDRAAARIDLRVDPGAEA